MLKHLLSSKTKIKLHLLRRRVRDFYKGYSFPQTEHSDVKFPFYLEITQEIKTTYSTLAKLKNISIAVEPIQSITINPNEVFSFWRAVGEPSKSRGFVESRSLINGELKPSVGGGLCQLSGLIYYMSLQADLEIVEHHSHSADIYTEETRFTPLGSDATVVYGYKDLRVQNYFDFPIKFSFILSENSLTIRLKSAEKIEKSKVEFIKINKTETTVEVATFINGIEMHRVVYRV